MATVALLATASPSLGAITGIPSGTPETVSGGYFGAQIPNPNNHEYYGGELAIGQSDYYGVDPGYLWWVKFVSDGVSDVIIDTFGTSDGGSIGTFTIPSGTELAIYDSSGNFILKQSRVRNTLEEEPGNVAPDDNGYLADLPPIGNRISNAPADPLAPVARGGESGSTNLEVTAIGPAPDYLMTLVPVDPTPIEWYNNSRNTSQIAFVKNPAPNPLWDPANPDYDPNADWDQYPILPAGEYFIAVTGGARFSGFAPDMEDRTIQVGDIVHNYNNWSPDGLIPDDGAGNPVPFGFTSIHSATGTIWLNLRNPGDFNSNSVTDATDIDLLFDRVAELAGQGLDPSTGVTLDGLPINFQTTSNWDADLHLSSTDMALDLTGNSRIDMGDVTMLVHNILGSEFGDANLDGVVDATDQALVEANLDTPGGWADGDFNGDDLVNQADLDILLANLPGLPGDLNGDGYVGLDDLQPILDHWNQNVTVGDASMGDIAGPGGAGPDGYVGLDDLQPVLDHWNEGTLPTPASIPEPGALTCLAGLGLLSLARRRSGMGRTLS